MENIIEFSHPEDPLPFANSFGDDLDKFLIIVFCQCMLIILLLFPLNQKSLSLIDSKGAFLWDDPDQDQ